MPTSVRLDARTQSLIARLAKRRGQTKSELIRTALETLAREAGAAETQSGGQSAYDRMAHVVGIVDSGGAGLSERTGERFRDLVMKQARDRRSR